MCDGYDDAEALLLVLRMDKSEPTTIHDLSDDDWREILKSVSNITCTLPLVLTSRRWRDVRKALKLKLRTAVWDLASNMSLLSWANGLGCPYPHRMTTDVLCRAAAHHDAIGVLRYARQNGCPFERSVCCASVQEHTSALACLGHDPSCTIRTAARWGHDDFIVAAREMGCQWGQHPMYDAASHGHLATIKLMHSMGCPINEWVAYAAATVGCARPARAVLQWLAEVGAPMKKAVEGVVMCNYHPHGNSGCDESTLDAMKIAHRLGGELTAETAASTLSEMGCDSPEFKWLVDEGCDLSQMPVEKAGELWSSAIQTGWPASIDDMQMWRANKMPWHPFALVAAIECVAANELAVVEWMVKDGCPVTGRAMYAACRIGDKRILPLLEFLDAQGRHLWTDFAVSDDMQDYPGDEDRQWACSFCLDAVIESGCIEAFKWMKARSGEAWIPSRALSTAASAGEAEMLKFLVSEYPSEATWQDSMDDQGRTLNTLGFVMESDCMSHAETMQMLELCVELGCPISRVAFLSASRIPFHCRPFEYLEWILQKLALRGEKLLNCSAAADEPTQTFNRHEAKKFWGYSEGLLDELVGNSQPGGIIHMPIARVKWLHARGVPLGDGTMNAAAKHGNLALLRWAHTQLNSDPGPDQGCCALPENAMNIAAYHGRIKSMAWLKERGCTITSMASIKAAANAQQQALIWLIEQGAPFDKVRASNAFLKAMAKAHPEGPKPDQALFRRGTSLAKNRFIWGSHLMPIHP